MPILTIKIPRKFKPHYEMRSDSYQAPYLVYRGRYIGSILAATMPDDYTRPATITLAIPSRSKK